jgi:hypothetical protein
MSIELKKLEHLFEELKSRGCTNIAVNYNRDRNVNTINGFITKKNKWFAFVIDGSVTEMLVNFDKETAKILK